MRRFVIVGATALSAGLLIASDVSAQVAGRRIALEGLRARAGVWGVGRPEVADVRDTVIPLFPSTGFYFSVVQQEHAGTFKVYVAVDSTGMLYLLDSPASFRLLVSRRLGAPLRRDSVLAYAVLAARFSGWVPAEARLIGLGPRPSLRPDVRWADPVVVWQTGRLATVHFDAATDTVAYRLVLGVNTETGVADLLEAHCLGGCRGSR